MSRTDDKIGSTCPRVRAIYLSFAWKKAVGGPQLHGAARGVFAPVKLCRKHGVTGVRLTWPGSILLRGSSSESVGSVSFFMGKTGRKRQVLFASVAYSYCTDWILHARIKLCVPVLAGIDVVR